MILPIVKYARDSACLPLGDCMRSKKAVGCPAELAVDVIRGRWKLMILREMCGGTVRFGELRRALKGVSEKVLTQHLRELERDGILTRIAYQESPPRVEYSLTAA